MKTAPRLSRSEFVAGMAAGVGSLLLSPSDVFSEPNVDGPLPIRLDLVQTVPLELSRVRGIAVDGEGCYHMAHAEGFSVVTPMGDTLFSMRMDEPAQAVAIREDGARFLATLTSISILDPSGRVVQKWGVPGRESGQLGYVTAVACGKESIYVADAGNRRVSRYSHTGGVLDQTEGFHIPSAYFDCRVDGQGSLVLAHTSEHRVETYTDGGNKAGAWGRYGNDAASFCGCCNPTHIATLPKGRIATTEKGIPRLKVYEADGRLAAYLSPEELGTQVNSKHLKQVGGGGALPCQDGWPGLPMGVDPEGRLAVVIPNLAQIRLYKLADS